MGIRDAVNISDLRARARERLPRAIFDFMDGGGEDEHTLGNNRAMFESIKFRPRVMVDVSQRDLSTSVLGITISMPLLISPTGMPGLFWPRGEVEAARAAHEAGTIYSLATRVASSLEEVAEGSSGPLFMQLYVWRDREITRNLIERAKAAGYRALILTVDTAIASQRERDVRNGFTVPPRVTISNALDTLRHVGWWRRMIGDRKITDRNFIALAGKAGGDDLVRLGGYVNRLLDPSVSWKDLEWIRQTWGGPFGLKGIMTPEDARIAVDHSVDFIVVSNHGGRQQDYVDQSVIALPSIVEAVDGRCEILLDSGVRRGADVVKAVALGARACLVGRPYLFGLAAGGGPGVARALEIFRSEIDRTLALVGCPNVAQLNRSYVRLPRGAASATGVTPRG